ncbi:hypothetical protein [Brevibacillus marinus]|nr:hypothetical protein [Brevibacillus marinus]
MLLLGILLVLLTLAVAIAISIKANQAVRNFDERHHESFVGSKSQT